MIDPCNQGTPPFMSIEALTTEDQNFTHQPCHDLESILYVIFYICTFTKGPGIPRTTSEVTENLPLRKWFSHEDPKDIGLRKLAHMSIPDLMITNHFTNYWGDFTPFAQSLASVCFPVRTCDPNRLTHKAMLEILHTAYAQVEEISDQGIDGRKRQHQGDHYRVPTKRGKRIVERVE
jgi:Fungal protein kinase